MKLSPRAAALGVVAVAAMPSSALAEPWVSEVRALGNNVFVTDAYQMGEVGGSEYPIGLGYQCRTDEKLGNFYLVTATTAAATTGTPEMATATFFIDGGPFDIDGIVWIEDGGLTLTFSEQGNATAVNQLYVFLVQTAGPVEVSFLDRKVTFSMDNAAAAINEAYDQCMADRG